MKVLSLIQLPPPIHGAAVVNAKAQKVISSKYGGAVTLNLSNATSIDDCDRLSVRKILAILRLYIKVLVSCTKKHDLVYFSFCPNGLAFYRDVIIAIFLQVFGIKHIFHLHGRGLKKGQGWLKDFLAKIAFRNAFVIHLSPSFWAEVSHLVPQERFFIVPNSADDIGLDEKLIDDGVLNVLYLSNYVKGKGPLYVLKIAELMWQRKVNCRFRLAGAWFDQSLKKEIDSWKLANKELVDTGFVEIGGPVEGAEKDGLFLKSDVFLFPSYIDTFPLAVIEAMSSGLTVVASDTGAIPDILQKTGLVCSEHNWQEMAEHVVCLANDRSQLHKYGSAARNRYEHNYTDQAFSRRLLEVITTVITDK